MVRINLINKEMSEVPYELTTFPDGEPHIKFTIDIDRKTDYKVICRITNPNDLFVLMQVGDILSRQAVEFELDIMYLMSMRMDRVITFNEAYTLNMVANIINGLNARKVRIFHCHSEKAFKLIHNACDLEQDYHAIVNPSQDLGDYTICYPDAGATERYYDNKEYHYRYDEENYIQLSKKRDLNDKGKIISLDIVHEPMKAPDYIERILIEDDLCDAGGTFVWAAKVLREKYKNAELCIFVRHLVNPIGLKNLSDYFDKVFITNSYKDWDKVIDEAGIPNVHVIDVLKH